MKMKTEQAKQVDGAGSAALQLPSNNLCSGGRWPQFYPFFLLLFFRILVILLVWSFKLYCSVSMNAFISLSTLSVLSSLAMCSLWFKFDYIQAMSDHVMLLLPSLLFYG